MRTILYSATPSNLSHFCDAISIKTGYILADESCIAGSPAHNIEFSHAMMQMSSIKYRLQFLQNKQDCDEEQRTAISQATEMLKSLTQVKHKNKAMLVMQRKLENIINDIFVSYLDEIQDKFTEAGFNGISELLKDEKTIIGYHHMHLVDPETSDTFFTKASLLLTRMGSSYEDEMEIYFLPFEFFLSEFAEDIPTSDNASGSQTPYLEKWMTMPAVSSLSATELRA